MAMQQPQQMLNRSTVISLKAQQSFLHSTSPYFLLSDLAKLNDQRREMNLQLPRMVVGQELSAYK